MAGFSVGPLCGASRISCLLTCNLLGGWGPPQPAPPLALAKECRAGGWATATLSQDSCEFYYILQDSCKVLFLVSPLYPERIDRFPSQDEIPGSEVPIVVLDKLSHILPDSIIDMNEIPFLL